MVDVNVLYCQAILCAYVIYQNVMVQEKVHVIPISLGKHPVDKIQTENENRGKPRALHCNMLMLREILPDIFD